MKLKLETTKHSGKRGRRGVDGWLSLILIPDPWPAALCSGAHADTNSAIAPKVQYQHVQFSPRLAGTRHPDCKSLQSTHAAVEAGAQLCTENHRNRRPRCRGSYCPIESYPALPASRSLAIARMNCIPPPLPALGLLHVPGFPWVPGKPALPSQHHPPSLMNGPHVLPKATLDSMSMEI
ncbi:hypothetical protein ACJZ2D_008790 [Fusarium nematophilum]